MDTKHTKHTKTFKMRISEEDNQYFEQLAKELSRSKSDALRFMARYWVRVFNDERTQKDTLKTNTPIQ